MEEIDLSKEIHVILSNDKRTDGIKSKEELEIILNKTFSGNEIQMNRSEWEKHIPIEKLLMGFRISGGCFVFSRSKFCVSSGMKKTTNVFSIEDFDRVKVVRGGWISDNIELDGKVIGKFNRQSIDPWNRIHNEINSVLKTSFPKNLKEKPKSIEKNKQEVKSKELKPKSDKDCKKKVEDKDQNNTKKIPSQERDKLTLNLDKNGKITIKLNTFVEFFKKELNNYFARNKSKEGFLNKRDTLEKINNSSWGSVLRQLKGKVKEENLFYSINNFIIFFDNYFLINIFGNRNDAFKDVYYHREYPSYLKIPYSDLFNYSKSILKDWEEDQSLGSLNLKTYKMLKIWHNDGSERPPMKNHSINGFTPTDSKGGYYPFKFFFKTEKTETSWEKWGETKKTCGLWFDKFNTYTQNINSTDFKNKIELKGVDLLNFEIYQYVFKWLEKTIEDVEIVIVNDILTQQKKHNHKRDEELTKKKESIFGEIDKDGNGLVDIIEGFDEIDLLLKKHQEKIILIDSKHVMEFVQVSNYLKLKKKNIQKVFDELKKVTNNNELEIYLEIIKDNIHVYDLITLNSLLMVNSLINMDMITFSGIYLKFDSLNIFDSKHEKDISEKLDNLEKGLNNLMSVIRTVGDEICEEIYTLSSISEESNRQLSQQLSEIDSTMKVGNLISTINTYQNYKNNRNTKNLRG